MPQVKLGDPDAPQNPIPSPDQPAKARAGSPLGFASREEEERFVREAGFDYDGREGWLPLGRLRGAG